MPLPIMPKSKARISHNVVVEYAEIPSVHVYGVIGWRLVDDSITFSEEVAIQAAVKLNRYMKKHMKGIESLILADPSLDFDAIKDGLELAPDDLGVGW